MRNASFAAEAKMEQSLKAQIGSNVIESVTFSLVDVSVIEVSIADLRKIFIELQKDNECAESIKEYLRVREYVCQGQQVLKATAKYSIKTNRSTQGSASTEQLEDAIRATKIRRHLWTAQPPRLASDSTTESNSPLVVLRCRIRHRCGRR